MNPILLSIILIPAVEIFLFIKIGSQIGALTTIFFIFITAIVGVYYAKYEGLNTLKSGFTQISKNKTSNHCQQNNIDILKTIIHTFIVITLLINFN